MRARSWVRRSSFQVLASSAAESSHRDAASGVQIANAPTAPTAIAKSVLDAGSLVNQHFFDAAPRKLCGVNTRSAIMTKRYSLVPPQGGKNYDWSADHTFVDKLVHV